MTLHRMDKETLAAFVDDELSPEDAAAVVMHLADCPEDQVYVDQITVDRDLLARAFAHIAREPVPESILAVIEGPRPPVAVVLAWIGPVSPRRVAGWGVGLAAAASVAAVVVLGLGLGRNEIGVDIAAGRVAPDSPLEQALASLMSGETRMLARDAVLSLAATFPDERGNLCREVYLALGARGQFEHAVACTSGSGWNVEIVVTQTAEPAGEGEDGYLPAAGPGSRAIERLLDDIGAGFALTADEEREAQAHGWRL